MRGLRVLDASNYAAGPLCAQILAGLGATVIKVERPPDGDPERGLWFEMFESHNRGKHSVALDLRSPDDAARFRELAEQSDVVIENFRPAVAARLGLDFASLSAVQTKIILVSVSGYGSQGPYADVVGYEHQFRALTGDLALSAGADGAPNESWTNDYPVYGYASAFYATISILAALSAGTRRATRIEAPLLAAGYAWMFAALRNPVYRVHAQHQVRHCFRAGDGRYLAISPALPAHFAALAQVIERPDLIALGGEDPFTWQYEHNAKFVACVEAGLAKAPAQAWVEPLRAAGVPVAPVLTSEEVRQDPHLAALGLGVEAPDEILRLPIFGLPTVPLGPAPAVDADGAAIRARGWAAFETASDLPARKGG